MTKTVEKRAVKKRNNKKVQPKLPMFETVDKLRREDNLVDNTITFHFADGSSQIQTINKAFVYTEKGKVRPTNDILEDINALVWDRNASHFSV